MRNGPQCRRFGFTLVELLVVIGIIALLIGILLPALNRAREAGNTIKCASNLRNVAAGMAIYLVDNKQTYPAAYIYEGMRINGQIGGAGTQTPDAAVNGYVHWSSYLYGNKDKRGTKEVFRSLSGWDVFTCPTIPNGGLPPTNTYDANLEPGQTNDNAGVIDMQAPRCAFTVNEAICPRNKFVLGYTTGGSSTARPYMFVRAGQVSHSSTTILATEFNDNWRIVQDTGNALTDPVCKSHRPVHGFVDIGGGNYKIETIGPDPYANRPGFRKQKYDPKAGLVDISADPQPGGRNPLDWIGRHHGRKKIENGWDTRKTNFLYVDGHVELKHVRETLQPFQWGDRFYSLSSNADMVP